MFSFFTLLLKVLNVSLTLLDFMPYDISGEELSVRSIDVPHIY